MNYTPDHDAGKESLREESSALLESIDTWNEDDSQKQRRCPLLWVILVETTLIILMGTTMMHMAFQSSSQLPPDSIFSPAQESIRYKNVVYSSGFAPHLTKYQGPPSPETNAAWHALYGAYSQSRITSEEEAKLANHTTPIPGDTDHSLVSIDVFHQLHCLQMLRLRAWYAEGYEFDRDMLSIDHIDHCIDSLRQSLMCASDITPLTWLWDEEKQKFLPMANIMHTCRDFDLVREWVAQHRVEHFDPKVPLVPNS
ncbi:hypothetical protein BDV40DRAFT_292412 [Aspergillus tamarii]|uniref:Tat pathway signal sequence n=1 Tax=Aspergillus tamarii TaxID=41984 RepID=A0A5N6UGK8_ASPTM|nr:hypothetical protein BDV40DRAFT_292412 [Aspergillus tamarii]